MEKTILEFSVELGVSKKKIENTIAKLKKEGAFLGEIRGGKRYLDLEAQKTIKETIYDKKATSEKPPYESPESEELRYLKERIEVLERLLENQQKLTAGALADRNQLQLELKEEKSKTWIQKLFNKK